MDLFSYTFNYFQISNTDFIANKLVEIKYQSQIWDVSFVYKLKNGFSKICQKPEPSFFVSGLNTFYQLKNNKKKCVLIGEKKDFTLSFFSCNFFLGSENVKNILYNSWKQKSVNLLYLASKKIDEWFLCFRPKKLFVFSDSLPFERLLIHSAKKFNCYSICFQHGLVSVKGGLINDGKVADKIICYDKYQKNILKKTGARNPVVGGFPFIKTKTYPKNIRAFVFLGQPWADYYSNKSFKYNIILKNLKIFCKSINFKFLYKPHPSEKIQINLDNSTLLNQPLPKIISEFYIFVSISSTSLVEAAFNKRLAIQIYDPVFNIDKFSKFHYCYTIDSSNLSKIKTILINENIIKK